MAASAGTNPMTALPSSIIETPDSAPVLGTDTRNEVSEDPTEVVTNGYHSTGHSQGQETAAMDCVDLAMPNREALVRSLCGLQRTASHSLHAADGAVDMQWLLNQYAAYIKNAGLVAQPTGRWSVNGISDTKLEFFNIDPMAGVDCGLQRAVKFLMALQRVLATYCHPDGLFKMITNIQQYLDKHLLVPSPQGKFFWRFILKRIQKSVCRTSSQLDKFVEVYNNRDQDYPCSGLPPVRLCSIADLSPECPVGSGDLGTDDTGINLVRFEELVNVSDVSFLYNSDPASLAHGMNIVMETLAYVHKFQDDAVEESLRVFDLLLAMPSQRPDTASTPEELCPWTCSAP